LFNLGRSVQTDVDGAIARCPGFDVIVTRRFAFEGTEEERKNWDKWLGDVYPGKAMKHAVKAERGGRR